MDTTTNNYKVIEFAKTLRQTEVIKLSPQEFQKMLKTTLCDPVKTWNGTLEILSDSKPI